MQAVVHWKPLRAWTDAQHARVASVLDAAWRAWQQAWLPAGDEGGRPKCVDAHDAGDDRWELLGRKTARSAWIRAVEPARLAEQLFGATTAATKSVIVRDVAKRALSALRADLARAADVAAIPEDEIDIAPAALFARWSGATVVRLEGAVAIEILLDADCMQQLAGAEPSRAQEASEYPVTPVVEALAGHKLKLGIELAGCELTLGELAHLRVGDVVTVPHPIDEPVRVTVSGQSLCAAYLGRSQGAKAVELARQPD
jgi:flagellar motor switch/type III secretory pathway protein FliN